MLYTILQIVFIIFDSGLATLFFLRFNGYKLREKPSFLILLPILVFITGVFNEYFDIAAIIMSILFSFFIMQIHNFDRVSKMRCFWSCILFYLSLIINNIVIYSIYQIFERQNIIYLVEQFNINYFVISLISKISLWIVTEIYIYIAEHFEHKSKNQNMFNLLFISTFNILLMVITIYLYEEEIIEINFVITMILLGIFLSGLINYYMYAKLSNNAKTEIELEILKQKNHFDEKFYKKNQVQYEKVNKLNHDIKNHLMHIAYRIKIKQYGEAIDYIENISKQTSYFSNFINVSNETLNFIINFKSKLAKSKGICIESNIEDIQDLVVNDFDLCTLLGNMLDNAIEAAAIEQDKYIIIEIYNHSGYQVYSIKNKIEKSILDNNSYLISHKINKDNHGYGLKQVNSIINKYNGQVDIFETTEYFFVKVLLPRIETN